MNTFFYFIESFCFVILISPALWEQDNDKVGDFNKGFDVVIRLLLMLASGLVNFLLRDSAFMNLHSLGQLLKGMVKPTLESGAMFFLTFDYWINWRLGHKEALNEKGTGWLEYLGKEIKVEGKPTYNWFDNIHLWQKAGWQGRLTIKVITFGVVTFFYFRKW